MRAPHLLVAAAVVSAVFLTPADSDSQVRVARPRPVVPSRQVVVSRPTVFFGSYYYPTFYRASFLYDPWYSGYYGYRPGYYGYGYAYPAYYQYPIYGPGRYYEQSGSVRLQVSPRQAEVFVDGYFAGTVDDFDGVFQRLNIAPGEHEVQMYLDGHRSFSQRFYLQPGKSFNIRHTMEPLGPGDAAPVRPDPSPLAGPGPSDDAGARGGAGRGGRGEVAGRRGGGAGGRGRTGGARGSAEGFGSLSLRVQPADAEVLIDGEPWQGSQGSDAQDNEPLVVQLGAGTHHIEIRKAGYRSYVSDIPLGAGQVRTLNVALTKQ